MHGGFRTKKDAFWSLQPSFLSISFPRKFLKVQCLESGQWEEGRCIPVVCEPPPPVFEGMYNCTQGFELDSQCVLSCEPPGSQVSDGTDGGQPHVGLQKIPGLGMLGIWVPIKAKPELFSLLEMTVVVWAPFTALHAPWLRLSPDPGLSLFSRSLLSAPRRARGQRSSSCARACRAPAHHPQSSTSWSTSANRGTA